MWWLLGAAMLLGWIWWSRRERRVVVPSHPTFMPGWDRQAFQHGLFDRVLQTYVTDGLVDYLTLRVHPQTLEEYLYRLAHTPPDGFKTREEGWAYWLNAYNAAVLYGILRRLPRDPAGMAHFSIKGLAGFFTRDRYTIGGRRLTLHDMAHGILRRRFGDPRCHMLLVNGASSAPDLRAPALTGPELERRLDRAAREFLAKPKGLRCDRLAKVLYLSNLFHWFADDFGGPTGIQTFLTRYGPDTLQELPWASYTVRFLDYDWSLNRVPWARQP